MGGAPGSRGAGRWGNLQGNSYTRQCSIGTPASNVPEVRIFNPASGNPFASRRPGRPVRPKGSRAGGRGRAPAAGRGARRSSGRGRSEEHTSELQSLMRISYAVFCLTKKKNIEINM